jgi:predicted  nucleic acid-binding Zn-ribbon protein
MAFLPILYRIQELDSKALALKKSLEQAAIDPNLVAVKALHYQSEGALAAIHNSRRQISISQRKLELELKTCQELLKHEEDKLYNGTVISSRSLEQVQQKSEEYRIQQGKLEDQILVLLEEDEKCLTQQDDLQKRLAACAKEIEGIGQEIKQQSAAAALELSEIEFELAELKPQIPAAWLERYQKIAKAHSGIGITKIKTDSCGACHVGLSDAMLRKAKQGEDTMIFCENCGRIIYYN